MEETAYWIGFNKVSGIGPARMAALIEIFGSAGAAWNGSMSKLKEAGLDKRSISNLLQARQTVNPQSELDRVRDAGIRVVTWQDVDYPVNLKSLDASPPLLYVRGTLVEDDIWSVGIVGTRRASVYGRDVASRVSSELARYGVTIVSGLALGIDTIAHKAALEAHQRTIAVLGSGVDQIYPPENRGLAARIAENGAVVSEYPLGARPEANNFPPRNRVISGLSKAVVIVEAPKRSGALITARFAAEQGRDVFAVPGNITSPGSAGCNDLIQKGATPLLSTDDVLEQLNLEHLADVQYQQRMLPLDPEEDRVLEVISHQPIHVDDIVRSCELTTAQVSSMLTLLELKGMVRQVGGLSYVRS